MLTAALPAQAQRWAQRVEVVKPVVQDGPAYALLDSLVQAYETADDSVTLRRTPNATRQPVRQVRDELLEDGLGLVSATHVFIQYEFSIVRDEFVETIEELQYIYRPPNADEEDISLFTVRTDEPIVREVMMNQGLPHATNLNAINTFATLLSFPRLASTTETTIVSLNNRTVRENYTQQRENLTAQLVELVYDDAMPVMTRTVPQTE